MWEGCFLIQKQIGDTWILKISDWTTGMTIGWVEPNLDCSFSYKSSFENINGYNQIISSACSRGFREGIYCECQTFPWSLASLFTTFSGRWDPNLNSPQVTWKGEMKSWISYSFNAQFSKFCEGIFLNLV